jgi:hypothetical protein
VDSVAALIANWPWSHVIDNKSLNDVGERRVSMGKTLAQFGKERLQSALVYLIASRGDTDEMSGGAEGAYVYFDFTPAPLERMLLSSNVTERKKLELYLTILMLEAPPPGELLSRYSGPVRARKMRLSPARVAYVCWAAKQFQLVRDSTDTVTVNGARARATGLIGVLRSEAHWGNPEAADLLRDPFVARTTQALVKAGYLNPK